jgi:4-amino-4-deoxy-L-arabinose transferase-like glycosyltransferase
MSQIALMSHPGATLLILMGSAGEQQMRRFMRNSKLQTGSSPTTGRDRSRYESRWVSNRALLFYLAASDFVFHMIFANNYGYFRDELYYIVSGTQHLSLGYVDFPPMIAYVAALLNPISGDSLFAIHVVPALAEGALVFISGSIAKELGGARRAQLLAATGTLVTLVFLADGSLFTMDPLDQIWWAIVAYLVIRIIKRGDKRLWSIVGLVVGVGLLTKLSMLFFVSALAISFIVFSSSRTYLRSKWLVLGGLIAFAIFLPFVYWNATNGWQTVQFYLSFKGYAGGGGPLGFFANQILDMNPVNLPLLAGGLLFYLRAPNGKNYRPLGLAYILLYVFMTIIDAKPYYLMPVYPMLFAAGALYIEQSKISGPKFFTRFVGNDYLLVMIVVAIIFTPLVMPILPPATYVNSYGALSGIGNSGAGQQNGGPFPQYLGDRFGWDTMVSTISKVYNSLPSSERSQACIFTSNYGEASALNFLGQSYGLPPAISGHNNCYVWGPGSCSLKVIITVGINQNQDQQFYSSVVQEAIVVCKYCMNSENNLPVFFCANPNFNSSLAVWSVVKHYD